MLGAAKWGAAKFANTHSSKMFVGGICQSFKKYIFLVISNLSLTLTRAVLMVSNWFTRASIVLSGCGLQLAVVHS